MPLPSHNAYERADEDDPTLSVEGLGDLLPEQGDRYDSTLSVSALDELFVPRLVAPITRAADEPRPIVAADDASEATSRWNDVGRDADARRLAAGSDPTPTINRPQELFAPELAAPIALVDEPRTLAIEHRQDIFAPELAAPIRRVVDEPRLIVSNAGRDTTGRDGDVRDGAGSARLVARVIEDAVAGPRVQEMFAPELCAPIRRVVEEPRLLVEQPCLVVEEPRQRVSEPELVSDAWQEATGRESDVEPEADIPPLVASVTHDDAISDLGRVEYEDPTLAVDSLGEFFGPMPVAPITRIVEELVPPGLESCLSDRQSSAEIRRAALEFQRFAEMFHAFATDIQQR